MPPKIRLTARLLRPPQEPTEFLLPVDEDAVFSAVWQLIKERYRENYAAGRRQDYYFHKAQDSSGADIDLRDSVIDIFGDIDPLKRIVQIILRPIERDDTLPVDSHLHLPRAALSPAQIQEIDKRRAEIGRWGSTVDDLDPDHPIESHESLHESKRDKDGFAIPAKINRSSGIRPPSARQAAHGSQDVSQDTYEDQLVRSQLRGSEELGSSTYAAPPFASVQTPPKPINPASQYSTLDAVPSAQKPPAANANRTTFDLTANDNMDVDAADSISEDEQPRLSNSATRKRNQPLSSRTPLQASARGAEEQGYRMQNLQGAWSAEENDKLLNLLAKGLETSDIHLLHFPNRSKESVRKKIAAVQKKKPHLSMPPSSKTPAKNPAKTPAKTPAKPAWTDDDDKLFTKAINNKQHWRTLHDQRFRDRSDDSVKAHYAEVRLRLEKENEAKSSQERYQEQVRQGKAATGPNEKFTQEEDDLLLACRLEGVEMMRVAKDRFPLRAPDQVAQRAKTLYNAAKREAGKVNPTSHGRSPSVEVMFTHDAATRDRIAGKLAVARDLKKRYNGDRARESEQSSQRKAKVAKDKERADERRVREHEQSRFLETLQKAKDQDDRTKRRRLNDDLEREKTYKQEMAAWKSQAALDRKAGRPTPPQPEPPRGSDIGTEVLVTGITPRSIVNQSAAASTKTPQSRNPQASFSQKQSTTKATASEAAGSQNIPTGRKRRASIVEVQVVIPGPSKKQKTEAADGASTKPPAKATNTPKNKLASTQKKPQAASTQPAVSSAKKKAQITAPRAHSSPGLPAAKRLRQTKLPFAGNSGNERQGSSFKQANALPRLVGPIDDSILISSDSETSYEDEEITDEELNAVAERSEAMYSSSPAMPRKQGATQPKQGTEVSRGLDMRSSPPVASVPTPKAAPFTPTPGLASAKKTAKPFSFSMPAVATTSAGTRQDTNRPPAQSARPHHRAKSDSSEAEIPESEYSAPEVDRWNVADGDILMTGAQTPTQASANAGLKTPLSARTLMQEQKQARERQASSLNKAAREPSSTNARQVSTSGGSRTQEVEAQLRQELARSTQTSENTAARENGTTDIAEGDAAELPDVTVARKKNTPRPQTQAAETDNKEVEDINVWRSESGDSELDDGWPSEPSENMPFSRPTQTKFGPFTYKQPKRYAAAPPAGPAAPMQEGQKAAEGVYQEAPINGTKATEAIRSPSVKDMAPPFPSSGNGKSAVPAARDPDGPFTSPTARFSERSSEGSGKKSRRRSGKGRRLRNNGIINDAHMFAQPSSTAPDVLAGLTARQDKKPAKINGKDIVAGPSETTPQQKTATKLAQKPAVTKPSSRLTANQIADQRLRDAANMPPEQFWQEENLQKMNAEQVLSHMIEQGVQRRMQDREGEEAEMAEAKRLVEAVEAREAGKGISADKTPPEAGTVYGIGNLGDDDGDGESEEESEDEEERRFNLECLRPAASQPLPLKPARTPQSTRSSTQPARGAAADDSSSDSSESDSDEEDVMTGLDRLAKQAEAMAERDRARIRAVYYG